MFVIPHPPPKRNEFDSIRVSESQAGVNSFDGLMLKESITEAGFPRVDLLKIDIEGAETELFKHSKEWIESVGAIAIEFHGNNRKASGFDTVMRQRGFFVDDSHEHTTVAIRT
jgi:hypothetical protein